MEATPPGGPPWPGQLTSGVGVSVLLRQPYGFEGLRPVGVGLEAGDLSLSHFDDPSGGNVEVDATCPAARKPPAEDEDAIANSLELLGVNLKALPVGLGLVLPPVQEAFVASVDPSVERSTERNQLDVRVKQFERRWDIASTRGCPGPANDLEVVLDHRPRSITQAEESARASCSGHENRPDAHAGCPVA